MKKLFLTLALVAVAATTAMAQISVGAGYVSSTMKKDGSVTLPVVGTVSGSENDSFGGFYVGANYNLNVTGGLNVAPGLYFSNVSHKYKNSDTKWKESYLTVPVFFNYSFAVMDGLSIAPYAGPYAQFCVSSKIDDNDMSDNYKKFDIGLGFGLALDIVDMIRVSVGYDLGLINRYDADNVTWKRSGVNFGVAYLF